MARVLHARDRALFVDRIESVGKQALDKSGKYPVNESDEEISFEQMWEPQARYVNLADQLTPGTLRVIASEAKQSIHPFCREMDCFAALAMTASFPPS